MPRSAFRRPWFLRPKALFESLCGFTHVRRMTACRPSSRRTILSLLELEQRETPHSVTLTPTVQAIAPGGTANFTLSWSLSEPPVGPYTYWTINVHYGDGANQSFDVGASGSMSLSHTYSPDLAGLTFRVSADTFDAVFIDDQGGWTYEFLPETVAWVFPAITPAVPQPENGGPTPGEFTEPSSDCPNQGGDAVFDPTSSPQPPADQLDDNAAFDPGEESDGPVRYFDGVVDYSTTDLVSNGFGTSWSQSRSWTNDPAYVGDARNGNGTIDNLLPHLVAVDDNTIAAVTSGITARYFDLTSGVYHERFSGLATFTQDSTTGEFTLTDLSGNQYVFAGFDSGLPTGERGQLLSETDPFGDVTTVSRNDDGTVADIQRSASGSGSTVTESFLYAYLPSGDANAGRIASVTLRRSTDGGTAWSTVREVVYAYYDGSDSNGNLGDLKTATLYDAGDNPLGTDYYRYYTSNSSTGYVGGLKFYLSARSFDRATGAGVDPLTAPDTGSTGIAQYADNYFEYGSAQRVTLEKVQGQGCSCVSDGGIGTYTFAYTPSTFTAGYNSWAMKTVEGLPDGNKNVVYTNAYGEVILKVFEDTTTGLQEATFYQYDSQGRVVLRADPSAVLAISDANDSYHDVLNWTGSHYAYVRDNQGLITLYGYAATTTATGSTPGDVAGRLVYTAIAQGQFGTPVLQELNRYIVRTAGGITVTPVALSTVFRTQSSSTAGVQTETTSYSYTWYDSTTQMRSEAVTAPIVTAAQNGPAQTTTTTTVFDQYGRPEWTQDAGGFLTYRAHDVATGAVTATIEDVDTTQTSEFTDLPTGWTTPAGGGLNLRTYDSVDALGRATEEISPVGNVTVYVYNDANHEVRTYPGWNFSTFTTTGPTQVTRDDRLHGYVETLTMSAAPDYNFYYLPSGTEPIDDVETLSRTYFNTAGQAIAKDDYFNLSGLTYSTSASLGTVGTNFYETDYGYDDRGRQDRVQSPTGTISRTVYNGLGWVISTWVGTDDTPSNGEEWTTDNTAGTNLVKVTENVYDGGGGVSGDGNLTQVTQFPNDGTANRVTKNFYDWRDRLVASKQGALSDPSLENDGTHRPIFYTIYDNLSEVVEQDRYDSDGVTITITGGVPNPPSSSLLRAKTTTSYDDQERAYQSNVWSVNASTGAVSTYALHTDTWYDLRGNVIKVAAPGGAVTKTIYDGVSRPTIVYTTDGYGDVAPGVTGTWASAGSVSGNYVLDQTETEYDGDGNAIQTTMRERNHDATGTGDLATSLSFDSVSDGGFETPAQTSYPYYQYNPTGSPWTFSGDSGISANGTAFTSSNPSAPDGTQVAFLQKTGSFSQSITLTAGQHVITFKAARRGSTNYDGPQTIHVSISGDPHSPYTFTPSSTNYQAFTTPTFTVTPGTHTLTFTGAPDTSNDVTDFIDSVQVGTTAARVTYTGSYYDAADRLTDTVDVGTNGGVAWTRPSTVPSRSDTVLVTSTGYNSAGWASSTIDPRGIETDTSYDNLGRTKQTVENVSSSTSADANKTTRYTYDGDNHALTYTLVLPGGNQQTTQYNYGVSTSTISSNDLLASVYHPDLSTGAASSSQADTYTYDALGEKTGFTDRNGTSHAYSFDVLGRPTADAATVTSSAVDNSVVRLTTAYDSQGNPYLLTSYNAASPPSIVNQVLRQYNGLGQMTAEYQEDSGAVTTSTIPVQYTYTEMAGGANNSRLTSMTVDGGWPEIVSYVSASGIDDRISRVTSVADYSDSYIEYLAYLGLDTVVQRTFNQPLVKLSYVGGGIGDAGDQYTGLDRFDRVVDQRWTNTVGTTVYVDYQYGYDRDSNRLYQKDLVNAAMSELYSYDHLNQLNNFARGTLNSDNTAISGSASRSQNWSIDVAGNFTGVTTNGTTQSQSFNAQNESSSLTYDSNGNTTTDDQGRTLVYDPWNRLVAVKSGSTLIAGYAYDAASRRVSETHGATTTHLYYSATDKVLVEWDGTTWTTNYWDPVAVDEPTLRIADNFVTGGETMTYALTTANGDVAAVYGLVPGSYVLERYAYDPYGQVTFLTPTYGARSSSTIGWEYLHQGLRWDSVVDLYDNRARVYSPTLMRFLQNDPLGFAAGDADLYRAEGDNPINEMDPSGLGFWNNLWTGIKELGPAAGRAADRFTDSASNLLQGQLNPDFTAGVSAFGNAPGKSTWEFTKIASQDLISTPLQFGQALANGDVGQILEKGGQTGMIYMGGRYVGKRCAARRLPTNWSQHQDFVTEGLQNANPGRIIGRQVYLDVTNNATGQTVRIVIDNLVPQGTGANTTYQLVDAKFSGVTNLANPNADLASTLTGNQAQAFQWISNGQPVTVVPVGQQAINAGLTPGVPINVNPSVQIYVNGPNGIAVRQY